MDEVTLKALLKHRRGQEIQTPKGLEGFDFDNLNEAQARYVKYLNGSFHNKLNTKNRLKIDSKFYKVMESEEIKNKIIDLRIRLAIPSGGFELPEADDLDISYLASFLAEELVDKVSKKEFETIKGYLKRYRVMTLQWKSNLTAYLYFNRIPNYPSNNLCEIRDVRKIYSVMKKSKKQKDDIEDYLENRPIAIFINPYASNNAIKEYISAIKDEIDEMKNAYLVEGVKKTRKKNKRVRNNAIIKLYLQGKTTQQICDQVSLEYDDDKLDQGAVGKIISIYNKKQAVKLSDTT